MPDRECRIKLGPATGIGDKPVGLNRPVELLGLSMGCEDGQFGEENQGSLLAQRASSDIDAREGAHKFVSGSLDRRWQGGGKTQEFMAPAEPVFGAVGEKTKDGKKGDQFP